MGHPVLAGDGDRMGGWEGVMSLGYLPSAPILQRWRVTLPVTGTHDLDRVRSPNPGRSLAAEEAVCLLSGFPLTLEQPRSRASGLIACTQLQGSVPC